MHLVGAPRFVFSEMGSPFVDSVTQFIVLEQLFCCFGTTILFFWNNQMGNLTSWGDKILDIVQNVDS